MIDITSFDFYNSIKPTLYITRRVVIDGEEYESRKKHEFLTVKKAIEYLYEQAQSLNETKETES